MKQGKMWRFLSGLKFWEVEWTGFSAIAKFYSAKNASLSTGQKHHFVKNLAFMGVLKYQVRLLR